MESRVAITQRWKQIIQLKFSYVLNWLKGDEGSPTIPLRFMAKSFVGEWEKEKLEIQTNLWRLVG
jgi:hypothetical protein